MICPVGADAMRYVGDAALEPRAVSEVPPATQMADSEAQEQSR
jgi:hypothetical protein